MINLWDEYIIDLRDEKTDSIREETNTEELNIDDNALFDFFYFFTNRCRRKEAIPILSIL